MCGHFEIPITIWESIPSKEHSFRRRQRKCKQIVKDKKNMLCRWWRQIKYVNNIQPFIHFLFSNLNGTHIMKPHPLIPNHSVPNIHFPAFNSLFTYTSKNLWYGFLINLLSLLNLPKKVDKTLQKNKLKTTLTFKQLTFTFKNFKRCFKMKELWVVKDSFPQRVLRGNTLHHYSRALPMLLMRRWNPTPTVTNQP